MMGKELDAKFTQTEMSTLKDEFTKVQLEAKMKQSYSGSGKKKLRRRRNTF